MPVQVHLCINQHTFEVPSFIDSKDMIVGQNLKTNGYGSYDPDHAH